METRQSQLNIINRISRIVVGAGLIGFTMVASVPLGYLTLLPLLAIYPIITGLFGEDPVNGALTNWMGGYEGHCFSPSSRIALIAVGVGAIGTVMANPQNLDSFGWISLASVYPIMVGLFGEDLFRVVEFTRREQMDDHGSVIEIEHREATILHHGFGQEHEASNKVA